MKILYMHILFFLLSTHMISGSSNVMQPDFQTWSRKERFKSERETLKEEIKADKQKHNNPEYQKIRKKATKYIQTTKVIDLNRAKCLLEMYNTLTPEEIRDNTKMVVKQCTVKQRHIDSTLHEDSGDDDNDKNSQKKNRFLYQLWENLSLLRIVSELAERNIQAKTTENKMPYMPLTLSDQEIENRIDALTPRKHRKAEATYLAAQAQQIKQATKQE